MFKKHVQVVYFFLMVIKSLTNICNISNVALNNITNFLFVSLAFPVGVVIFRKLHTTYKVFYNMPLAFHTPCIQIDNGYWISILKFNLRLPVYSNGEKETLVERLPTKHYRFGFGGMVLDANAMLQKNGVSTLI